MALLKIFIGGTVTIMVTKRFLEWVFTYLFIFFSLLEWLQGMKTPIHWKMKIKADKNGLKSMKENQLLSAKKLIIISETLIKNTASEKSEWN